MTNAVGAAAMSGQLSFDVTLGVPVGVRCSQGPAVAAPGWHQTAHRSEAWGPAASERDSVYVNLWDDHLDPA